MRVLHCIYDDPANPWVAGGGAVRVREIYRRLADRVGSVTVATGAYPGSRDEVIDGIAYRRLGAASPYWWSRLTYSVAASGLLARGDYDAAVFDFSTYTPIRLPRNRPVGVTVHHLTGLSATARWGRTAGNLVVRQERIRLRAGRYFSATSQITNQRLRTILGPAAHIELIQAGVPDELFELTRREADYLLYFGRMDWYQKGLDILLEAVRLARERYPDLLIRVAGRGKDSERVLKKSYELGIRDNVQMYGAVDDEERDELFAGARMLIMPSRFEGFGMVAAEAMAAGVPLITSDAGSLPEVVDPPRGGITVPTEDPGALAAAICDLNADRERRRTLSRSARESAQRFRWDAIAEQHLRFLEEVRSSDPRKSSNEV